MIILLNNNPSKIKAMVAEFGHCVSLRFDSSKIQHSSPQKDSSLLFISAGVLALGLLHGQACMH